MSWNNKVELIGSLGADPEFRYTQGGQAVMNFRMATTEKYTDKNKVQREETEWHSCVVWGDKATEYQLHLRKGSYVRVEGKLKTEPYEKDGVKHYPVRIIVSHIAPAAFPRAHDKTPAPPNNPIPFGAPATSIDQYGDLSY